VTVRLRPTTRPISTGPRAEPPGERVVRDTVDARGARDRPRHGDLRHFVIERVADGRASGYVTLAGLANPGGGVRAAPHRVTDKGRGPDARLCG